MKIVFGFWFWFFGWKKNILEAFLGGKNAVGFWERCKWPFFGAKGWVCLVCFYVVFCWEIWLAVVTSIFRVFLRKKWMKICWEEMSLEKGGNSGFSFCFLFFPREQ